MLHAENDVGISLLYRCFTEDKSKLSSRNLKVRNNKKKGYLFAEKFLYLSILRFYIARYNFIKKNIDYIKRACIDGHKLFCYWLMVIKLLGYYCFNFQIFKFSNFQIINSHLLPVYFHILNPKISFNSHKIYSCS